MPRSHGQSGSYQHNQSRDQQNPIQSSNMNLDWSQAFRSWPNTTPGWRNWFRRVANSYRADWEQYDISQCLNLSLSEMVRNKPMLILASFFWSDSINAILFGHGPMSPTLLDIMMLTGLNISASDKPFYFSEKASFKIETRSIGGWKGYVARNMKTGSVSVREHTAFLNMWLEKFIFCGKAIGPTTNTRKMDEDLAFHHYSFYPMVVRMARAPLLQNCKPLLHCSE